MDISVVIPLFNKEETIHRALMSVMEQSELPSEIIVVNDGSTDGSEQVVSGLNHPLVQLINQENAGVSAARNTGIAAAKYEWIAFLDADDFWKSNFIHEIVTFIQSNPHLKAVGTNYFFQEKDKCTINPLKRLHEIKHNTIIDYFNLAAYNSPPIWTGAVCVKRSLLLKLKGFNEQISSGEDLLLWATIASNTSWGYINKPLSVYNKETATKRRPENPDVVFKELKVLQERKKESFYAHSMVKYISFWLKIRASQYVYHRDLRFFLEIFKMFKYRVLSFKILNP